MSDQSKALARRYFERLLSKGDLAIADEIIAEDVAFRGPNYWGEVLHGRPAFVQFIAMLRTAFPDLDFTIVEELAEGDKVATSFRMRGTHRAEWMGLPATGKQMDLAGVDIFHVADGKIKEIAVYYDTLGLMQQLGVIPTP